MTVEEWRQQAADCLARLNAETVKVLARPDVQSTLGAQGLELAPGTPEQFAAHIRGEAAKWGKLIKSLGIRADQG